MPLLNRQRVMDMTMLIKAESLLIRCRHPMKKLIRLKLLRKTLPLCILQGGLFLFRKFKICPADSPMDSPAECPFDK